MFTRRTPVVSALLLGSACFCPLAAAQTDPALLLNDWAKNTSFESQGATYLSGRAGLDDGASTRFNLATSQGRFKLSDTEIPAAVGYDYRRITLSANPYLPQHLDDASFALGTPVAGGDDWFVGLIGGAGYAGDNALADSRAWYGIGSLVGGYRRANGDRVIVDLTYNGNATLFPDFPVPAFEYITQVNPQLTLALGFPVLWLQYTPTFAGGNLDITLEYNFPDTVDVRAQYRLAEPLAFYVSYGLDTSAFHRAGEPATRRIFFTESRAEVGLTFTPLPAGSFILAGGYTFDREFERGFDLRGTDHITDVQDQVYIRLGFDLQF